MIDEAIDIYRKLVLIRRSEEAIRRWYGQDEMKTPMHMSMGEEAIPVGVCAALASTDQVMGTYRTHALYLAKTDDVDGFFAELYGRASSPLRGKCGSMHLSAPEHGMMGCSAIVASAVPVSNWLSFANRYQANGKLVAVFFGDGAVEGGVFWESLNFACLRQLPILLVCEDNGLAVHTKPETRHGYDSITRLVAGYRCDTWETDSTDAVVVRDLARRAIGRIREGKRPGFLRCRYYRYLEHVGINTDFDAGYRTEEGYREWLARDPVDLRRRLLLEQGVPEERLCRIEAVETERVRQAVEKAKAAEFCNQSALYEGVFAGA